MKDRRIIGIFLGICGLLSLFFSIRGATITGAVIGGSANISFFGILGLILIIVSVIIEIQERQDINFK